jgi:acyl carrier protein
MTTLAPFINVDLNRLIQDAMIMAGLQAEQIDEITAGGAIYGEAGQLDSLGLVRLIGALGQTLEDRGIDLFDMMQVLDLEATEAFASLASIQSFVLRIMPATSAEVA